MPAWASSWRSSTITRATGPGTAPTHTRADTSRIAGLAARSAEGAPHSQPVRAASTLFIGTACSVPSRCTATRRRAQRRRGELVEDYGIDRVGSSDFPGLNVAHTFRGTAAVEASDLCVASSRRCRAGGRSARSAAAADVDGRDGVGGGRASAGVRVVGCVGVGTMAGVALGDLVGGHRRCFARTRGGCPWASSSTTSAASHARRVHRMLTVAEADVATLSVALWRIRRRCGGGGCCSPPSRRCCWCASPPTRAPVGLSSPCCATAISTGAC